MLQLFGRQRGSNDGVIFHLLKDTANFHVENHRMLSQSAVDFSDCVCAKSVNNGPREQKN